MNVDFNTHRYKDENQCEEDTDVQRKHSETIVSAFNEIRQSVDCKRSSNNDQTDVFDYLTLIQGIQRTRKFTEISNELRQHETDKNNLGLISRRELLLNQNRQNNEIPGKYDVCYLNLDQNNTEIDQESVGKVTNASYLEGSLLDRAKRNKSSETDISSDCNTMVDLSHARLAKILHQNMHTQNL